MTATIDRLSRPLRDLRISVTDRCNLRCRYCMPREAFGPGHAFLPRGELLSFEEITRICGAFVALGVRKVRLTGGEPLLRRELERLIEMLAGMDGLRDIAMTTNGTMLAARAARLRQAGLSRVTVSLDALDARTLSAIGDVPLRPQQILAAIDAAEEAGLTPVKVNMVVRKGINDGSVIAMAEHFRHRPQILRFIEYMDVGSTNRWRQEDVLSAAEMRDSIAARWPLEPLTRTAPGEVASRYRYLDGAGEVGFIHSVSAPFCGACSRARLSADGRLHMCLFATSGLDLRAPLRECIDDGQLRRLIAGAWGRRVDRYSASRRSEPGESGRHPAAKIEMSYIGG